MKIFKKKSGQGATEYLLILAAVLVVVAVAVYFITRTTPKPNIGIAVAENSSTSIKVHATSGTDTCAASDWQYKVYASGAADPGWTAGTQALSSGMTDIVWGGLTSGTTYVVRIQHITSGQYFFDSTVTLS